ncbi:diacylglycerol/lipid kinase family protein [Alkalibacterium sp. MB6]|uniref:diacylglycerol/lipid kinase family protein n=1 Tax=Alkalibacterium sp. MB6 TaxID=2081965 RepID=UPI00137A2C1A|nr:diacylglycerol kinase family protein [Alkalibacterium sp. MB6]
MSKAVVIVNPTSGREEGKEMGPKVKEALLKKYDEVDLRWTEGEGDATRFANEATKEGVDAIYALGGDGTVNECINGIAPEPVRPAFGFIPMGTVNDLGRVLGIPMDSEEAVDEITSYKKKRIDIGRLNNHYFADIMAIGSIPDSVQNVPIEKKTKLGPLAYVLEGTKAFVDKENYPLRFSFDDEVVELDSFLVLVALTNSVGGIKTMIPEASVDDGYLHLVAIEKQSKIGIANLVPKIFTGKLTEDDHVFYRKIKKARIELREEAGDQTVLTNIDGDEGDALPVTVEVFKHHIDVFVPAETE